MTTSESEALKEQGIQLYYQKDYEAAARIFQQALTAYEAAQQPDMVAEMRTNIGLVHRALGQNQQALDEMQLALSTFQEHDDKLRAAQVLGNMGGVYIEINDKEQAYNCYRQAADIFQELGEKKLYGETLLAMGAMQVRDGKLWQGAATYEVGLDQLEKLSPTQKILKGLIGVKNRLSGGGNAT